MLDLTFCEYLDSTFLGCLVELHKCFGCGQSPRFLVAAPPDQCQRLLAPTRLNTFLNVTDTLPRVIADLVALCAPTVDFEDLPNYVMECHRRLAEFGGRNEAVFRSIADQLAREIEAKRSGI